jgi:hypothetical protein
VGEIDSTTSPAASQPRRVVYSALMGRYERLQEQPVARTSHIPFVLFTDDPELRSETWDVRLVAPRIDGDSVRSSRWIKIRAGAALDEYDETLWIDNRVRLRVDPAVVFSSWLAAADAAVFEHSFRDQLIDEFSAVVEGGYDDPAVVYRQLDHYVQTTPELLRTKPLWTGMIARRTGARVDSAMGEWWEQVERFSRRDQLSAPLLYGALGEALTVIAAESNHASVFHEWPPISSALGRRLEEARATDAVKPAVLRLREAEVAVSALSGRIDEYAVEISEWEDRVRYRDEAIRHLQETIDVVRRSADHTALIARDTVVGVNAQLATVTRELAALRARHEEVSEGFEIALRLLEESKEQVGALRRRVRRLRRMLDRERQVVARQGKMHSEQKRRIDALTMSVTWKVAHLIARPFARKARRFEL